MEIKEFAMSRFNNEGYFQFDTDCVGLIDAATPEALRIEPFYTAYREQYSLESEVIEKIRKSELTDPIAAKDSARDNMLKGMHTYVDAFTWCDGMPEKKKAAGRIRIVTHQYGNMRRKPYNEETVSVTNLIGDLRNRCAAGIDTIGLPQWIDSLEQINNEFAWLMGERYDKKAQELQTTASNVRREMDTMYGRIEAAINTFAYTFPDDPVYADFIGKLNARIDYYQTSINRKSGGKDEKSYE